MESMETTEIKQEEWKKLFVQMDSMEQYALINAWKKVNMGYKSFHCIRKMERCSISEYAINRTWENNHIIEFKVKDGNKRLVIRSVESFECNYDICNNGEKVRYNKEAEPCNVCLVVDMDSGNIITCYTCPISMKNQYKNKYLFDSSYSYATDVRMYL